MPVPRTSGPPCTPTPPPGSSMPTRARWSHTSPRYHAWFLVCLQAALVLCECACDTGHTHLFEREEAVGCRDFFVPGDQTPRIVLQPLQEESLAEKWFSPYNTRNIRPLFFLAWLYRSNQHTAIFYNTIIHSWMPSTLRDRWPCFSPRLLCGTGRGISWRCAGPWATGGSFSRQPRVSKSLWRCVRRCADGGGGGREARTVCRLAV